MANKRLWKTENIIKGYELAKSGMSMAQIAKALGTSQPTIVKWIEKKEAFRIAVNAGRKISKGNGKNGMNFRDYVYKRLPEDLKKLWREINKMDKAGSGVEKIEALLVRKGMRVRQHLFLYAWVASNFSISNALGKVNISRTTFDYWKEKDPEFAMLVEEINWHKKNFFEDHLCKLVAGGDVSSTIFANETYNRDRGYSKRQDLNVNLTGETTHSVILVDSLGLSLKERKKLLQKMKNAKTA